MRADDNPLSPKEFENIYAKVPRLTVEIVILNKDGEVYLTQRAIEPCKGQWHLPGGTVRFAEPLLEAVKRIAKRELGIQVTQASSKGYIEYPSHYLHGLDCPVGLVFEVAAYEGRLAINSESTEGEWFSTIPENMHADQDAFLSSNGYLEV